VRIADLNWLQVEEYLRRDDRIALPLGSTEQHAYLSLATDNLLAERVAVEAAEPLGVPVLPVLPYGVAPSFLAYPGTVSLPLQTFLTVVRDVLDALYAQGFRRVLVVNGHGGNTPVRTAEQEWAAAHPDAQALHHDWWMAPRTMAAVRRIDPDGRHASWMENFPWTRLDGVELPGDKKPMVDVDRLQSLDPAGVRELLGDGSFGGLYQRPDEEVLEIWKAGVEETRELLERGWRRSRD
jgi:creatinine amidohydrolase